MTDRVASHLKEALAVTQASTDVLRAELQSRGYKTYPSRRVRVYHIVKPVDSRLLAQMPSSVHESFSSNTWLASASTIGRELQRKGALITRTAPEGDDMVKFMTSIMVVLPKTFDFEKEAKEERDAQMAKMVAEAKARGGV
jgi:hypothetical protein